jgi:hypothetical protein
VGGYEAGGPFEERIEVGLECREKANHTPSNLRFCLNGGVTEQLEARVDGTSAAAEKSFELANIHTNDRPGETEASDDAPTLAVVGATLKELENEVELPAQCEAAILPGEFLVLVESASEEEVLDAVVV